MTTDRIEQPIGCHANGITNGDTATTRLHSRQAHFSDQNDKGRPAVQTVQQPIRCDPPIEPNARKLEYLPLPLVDGFARAHRAIRVSVTDRCNIRCQYCMPEVARFLPSAQLLSFDQITEFVKFVTTLGIRKLRLTGGEPLMRPNLHWLVRQLSGIEGLGDIALTTNGMLLAEQVDDLVAAGLRRINISLDTLNEAVFKRLSRREGIQKVLAGIDAAVRQSSLKVRLNAMVMRDINLNEVLELVAFARERELPLRFIEFMPLDAQRAWSREQMVAGAEMRNHIAARFGALVPVLRSDTSQPAVDYTFSDGIGVVGFIDSVTQPFCAACDRLRLTADGKLRNCLFGTQEWDVAELLSRGAADSELESVVRDCLAAKHAAHGIDAVDFAPPTRAMFQIGG